MDHTEQDCTPRERVHDFTTSVSQECHQGASVDKTVSSNTTKGRRRRIPSKVCRVCGSLALSNNFGAVCCESCKAFFRRNAHKILWGRCDGKCDITLETRSYCKKCRLSKCFAVGMKLELLDAQKRDKNSHNQPKLSPQPEISPIYSENSSRDSNDFDSISRKEGQGISSWVPYQQMEAQLLQAVTDPSRVAGLSETNRTELYHLVESYVDSHFRKPEPNFPSNPPTSTLDLHKMSDFAVRRIIKMAKTIKQFSNLQQGDQISLLKGSVVEIMVMRSATVYDAESRSWQVSKGQMSAQVLFSSTKAAWHSFSQEYCSFTKSLMMAARNDHIIVVMLMVIALFSADCPGVVNQTTINDIQEHFAMLLQEYIKNCYGEQGIFPRVMQKLTDVRSLGEKHGTLIMDSPVDELDPLIVEIFDLLKPPGHSRFT